MQPTDYFTLFDIPASFALDLSDLEKRYFALQRRFHPDRLVGKSAQERQSAIAESMRANEAYEALKDPLKRAQHLLLLKGIKHDGVKPSHRLLTEIMELRESLAEAETEAAVESLAQVSSVKTLETQKGLLQAFHDSDIPEAAQLTMRLSYLLKMQEEIRLRRKRIAS